MAKYTTLLRTILEVENGNTPVDATGVDTLIADNWDKIITTTAEFFDPEYKSVICCKLLKHYFMREIGAETVGQFKLWLNTKMEEILPYYNMLWESALLEFDPLNDIDITTERNGGVDGMDTTNDTDRLNGTDTRITNDTTVATGDSERTNHDADRYSDTPQGTLGNIENNTYLTNARIIDGTDTAETTQTTDYDGSTQNTINHTNTRNGSKESHTTEEWLSHTYGKNGGISYSRYLKEFRETFLNIDMMFIEEFKDCFMQLW